MSTTAVHPQDLAIGQFIRFTPPPRTFAPGRCAARESGRIVAKTVNSVLIEHGLTLAGTRCCWLSRTSGSPAFGSARRGGRIGRVFRDTPALLAVAGDGALHLDADRTPCAS